MSERRSRRVILIALGISLLLHVLLAGWLRLPSGSGDTREAYTSKTTHLQIIRRVRVVKRTTPQHVAVKPVHSPAIVRHVSLVQLSTHPSGTVPVVAVAQTAAPTPTAVPADAGACRDPNAKAAISVLPSPPDIPNDVRAAAVNGVTAVLVRLSADGSIIDAAVVQSSGNAGLDQIGLAQARDAQYTPALANCKPIAGDYTFKEKWTAW
jgi:TonB family protein